MIQIGIVLIIVLFFSILFATGIDYMNENHSGYKGDDFLDWDEKNETNC
jgi:hypothetical protein